VKTAILKAGNENLKAPQLSNIIFKYKGNHAKIMQIHH
jgi:hypothetical protein